MLGKQVPVVQTCKVVGYLAAVDKCYIWDLLVNASAQLLGAPPLPLIVCDL